MKILAFIIFLSSVVFSQSIQSHSIPSVIQEIRDIESNKKDTAEQTVKINSEKFHRNVLSQMERQSKAQEQISRIYYFNTITTFVLLGVALWLY